MDFMKALQTAGILIDVIKALHAAITENTEETKRLHESNQLLSVKLDSQSDTLADIADNTHAIRRNG